jgi:hypothetical protein
MGDFYRVGDVTHSFVSLGALALLVVGIAVFLLLNFAAYYFPTRYALRRAGIAGFPMAAAIRGFLGMLLIAFLVSLFIGFLAHAG